MRGGLERAFERRLGNVQASGADRPWTMFRRLTLLELTLSGLARCARQTRLCARR